VASPRWGHTYLYLPIQSNARLVAVCDRAMIIGGTSVFKRLPSRARDHVVGFNHSAASP
jgi:hypothetical protein